MISHISKQISVYSKIRGGTETVPPLKVKQILHFFVNLSLYIDILHMVCYNDYAILLIKMGEEYLSLQGVHYSW